MIYKMLYPKEGHNRTLHYGQKYHQIKCYSGGSTGVPASSRLIRVIKWLRDVEFQDARLGLNYLSQDRENNAGTSMAIGIPQE